MQENIKTEDIKTRLDLAEDIIIPDIGEPVKAGSRLKWRCPFHEDHDPSLFLTPDGGGYRCFGCGARGDAFTWVMERNGWDFKRAKDHLASLARLSPDNPKRARRSTAPALASPPATAWQTRARALLKRSQALLWEDAGTLARDYLHGRGLSDATIRAWGLGWCPRDDLFEPPGRWGLAGKKIYFPRGVVIPHRVGADLWALKVRRFVGDHPARKEERGKYGGPRGGRATLYGAGELHGDGRPMFLVEAELDALLLWQAAGDLVDVAALATASRDLSPRWLAYLLPYPRIFAALDADGAGAANMARLADLSGRIIKAPVPKGNDVTEYHQAAGDVRAWVESVTADPVTNSDEKQTSAPTRPQFSLYDGRIATDAQIETWLDFCDLAASYGQGPTGDELRQRYGLA